MTLRPSRTALGLALLLLPVTALAQDDESAPDRPGGTPLTTPVRPGSSPRPDVPPELQGQEIDLRFVDADLLGLLKYFALATKRDFILGETRELENKKITIISRDGNVPARVAWEAFLSALEIHGLTVVRQGNLYKVVEAGEVQQSGGSYGVGTNVRGTDQYITQVIQFENVSVSDVREIVDNLVSPEAKVLAFQPSNTLIITDTGYNIRRVVSIINELDVGVPTSSLRIYPIAYASADEIKSLIEELYATGEEAEQEDLTPAQRRRARRRRRRNAREEAESEGVTAGEASNYISKVLSDERTNSLIILANEQGHEAVMDLIRRIDIDVDPTSRSQIYVYRLEHAKAEDVSSVLTDLAGSGGRNNNNSRDTNVDARTAQARARARAGGDEGGDEEGGAGAIAVFDDGLRIAADENTNSLVIIANKDDYEVIRSVIQELDTRRKQVFVDAVIMELTSNDSFDFNLAYHAPVPVGGGATSVIGGQFGTNSFGFDPSNLSGFSAGVFGETIDIPIVDPTSGSVIDFSVPTFGIALEALKTNQLVNIVSSPSLIALDNEEARIVVGRKIPFPTSNGLSSFGQPLIQYQREDVAITMEMTPRVNSENFVTLEVKLEVQDVEEGEGAVNIEQAGPTTSNRELETSIIVGDNQTVVLGGLVSTTEAESESKIPILGDLPILGALFRNRSTSQRRTNLMIFLTPHIVDDEEDMREIMRVKEAQRSEFMRRFYGKSQDEQLAEIQRLLAYSMNAVDRPSVYRGPATIASTATVAEEPISAEARNDLRDELERADRVNGAGDDAGRLVPSDVEVILPGEEPEPATDEVEGATDEASADEAAADEADEAAAHEADSTAGEE